MFNIRKAGGGERMKKKIAILIAILVITFVVAGCSTTDDSGQLKPKALERKNDEGGLEMNIIFANPLGQGKDGYLTFVVQMDNHSYNLDEYEFSKYATLIDDKGNSPKGNPTWEVTGGGGHHVINTLLFPDDGLITPGTKYIKLIIKDFIDVPEREFIWEKEFLGIKE